MNALFSCKAFGIFSLVLAVVLSSCTADQTASRNASGSNEAALKKATSQSGANLAEKRKEARESKAKEREATLAAKKKADAAKARELAEAKEEAEKRKQELALKEEKKREAARQAAIKRRADMLAERERQYLARRRAVDSGAIAARNREVQANAARSGSGFFSRMAVSSPAKYRSKGHEVKVNHALLGSLTPSNSKIEIDLSEQKARVYKVAGGQRQMVIETRVSTGKSGYSTPTGTYRISEKLVEKRSTLYGTWLNSSGQTIQSSGEAANPPSGASTFVGAEMPYWMRINGGIGLHIGYVPNGPASHGCIRVPSSVQPLIYSKVGVGTPVSVIN